MLFSYNWLSELVDLTEYAPEKLANQLSLTGLEVEEIINFGDKLNQVVVGQIDEIKKHPDSDRLFVTQVNVGVETLQIVLGAQNAKQGDKVITALTGAHLPNDLQVNEVVLRGVSSSGMLCSLQELGFSEQVIPTQYSDGIYILPEDAPVGMPLATYLALDDAIIELDLTPNRADALSMRGIAYEAGAVIGVKPKFESTVTDFHRSAKTDLDTLELKVSNQLLAPRYQLRLIRDVKIVESPIWLQFRLMTMGMRPINNVVDATNYYQLLYGQPMHAFDWDQLPGKDIEVRHARTGEVMVTLDNQERQLVSQDVVISSNDEAVAIAGVMGGASTEVTPQTTNVLLETATFESLYVRMTANRLGLHSDASARFEKGINLATIDEAGTEAAYLIAELGQGAVESQTKEFNALEIEAPQISVSYEQVEKSLGVAVSQAELAKIFDRLNFEVDFSATEFTVNVPARRWDISIVADVMEEIARIYGYDQLPTTLPVVPSTPGRLNKRQRLIRQTRSLFEGLGLNEAISYVLVSPENAQILATKPDKFVTLSLPLSEERQVLRQSLLPSLIEIVKYNQARGNKPIMFYETGKTYFAQGKNQLPVEQENLAIILSGEKQASTWYQTAENFDFFDLKGIFESYFQMIRLSESISYERCEDLEELHPSRTVNIKLQDQIIGYFGQVHPLFARQQDIPQDTYFGELNLELLLVHEQEVPVQDPIPRYPATSRDLALLVSVDQTHQELVDIIEAYGGEYLIAVDLFDQYQGKGIGEEQQSLAYHLVFQSSSHTLQDKEVDEIMAHIIAALENIEDLEIR